MSRSILAVLVFSLLAALPASAQRLSVASVDRAQKRMTAAICAKADADGDSYRPFVCTPRCDCLAGLLDSQSPQSCDETTPGSFAIEFPAAPGTCGTGGFCANSTGVGCLFSGSAFVCTNPGEVCVSSSFAGITLRTCRRPCSSDASCPGTAVTLTGVGGFDTPDVAVCTAGTAAPQNINSNDARLCIAQVEESTGPCQ
jgi:hypothetical protein